MDRLAQADALAALMQRVGFAVWQLQELENTAATYVVLRLRQTRGVGAKRGNEIAALVEKSTLGKLLRELRLAGILLPELADRLEGALEERNWLVHRARREYRGVLADGALYAQLSQRIDKLAEDTRVLLSELGGEVEGFVRSSGVDMQEVAREAQRLAASWGLAR